MALMLNLDQMATRDVTIRPALRRRLADKLHQERVDAAAEIVKIVKGWAIEEEDEKITALVDLLATDFVRGGQTHVRQGGLLGLEAVTKGFAAESPQHLQEIVKALLPLLSDEDRKIRCCACKTLYSIAKVLPTEILVHFNSIFDSLCELSVDTDPNVQSATYNEDQLLKELLVSSREQVRVSEFVPALKFGERIMPPTLMSVDL